MEEKEIQIEKTKSSNWTSLMQVALGAVLGCGGTVVGGYVLQESAAFDQAVQAKSDRAQALYEEYESLSPISGSAGRFARGIGGKEEDLVTMFRHFRKVTKLVNNDRVDSWTVADLYGNILSYWSDQFYLAANADDTVDWQANQATLSQMEALSGFLETLHQQARETAELRDQVGNSDALLDEALDEISEAAGDWEEAACEGAACEAACEGAACEGAACEAA